MFRPDSWLLQTGEAAWRRDVTRVPGAASGIFEQKIYKYKKRGKRMFTKLTEQLKANPRTIVFTVGTDARILDAAA